MPRGQRVLSGLVSSKDAPRHNNATACTSLQSVLLHHCGAPAEEQPETARTCSELMQLYARQCTAHEEPHMEAFLPPVG